jgi:hypothetical protein
LWPSLQEISMSISFKTRQYSFPRGGGFGAIFDWIFG